MIALMWLTEILHNVNLLCDVLFLLITQHFLKLLALLIAVVSFPHLYDFLSIITKMNKTSVEKESLTRSVLPGCSQGYSHLAAQCSAFPTYTTTHTSSCPHALPISHLIRSHALPPNILQKMLLKPVTERWNPTPSLRYPHAMKIFCSLQPQTNSLYNPPFIPCFVCSCI